MLGQYQIALFILSGVDVTRQIEYILARLISLFLRDPLFLSLPLVLGLTGQSGSLGLSRTISLALRLPTEIIVSGVGLTSFPFAITETVFLFSVCVPSGYLHHSAHGQRS